MFKIDRDLRAQATTRKIKSKDGEEKTLSYLVWANLVALAEGRVEQRVVEFGNRCEREVFGGTVVAVEQKNDAGQWQRIYLPVLDGTFQPVPFDHVPSTDVQDAISRCRAKAISCVSGLGMDLYMDFGGDGPAFAKAMGDIDSSTDLSKVQPLLGSKERKRGPDVSYIPWASALTAALLADPEFAWGIEEREITDASGKSRSQPYVRMGTGYGVGVTVNYRGQPHTEWLSIMGMAEVETKLGLKMLDNQPLTNPNAADWNRAVMRCLAKAVAVASGYGLNLYAKADLRAVPGTTVQAPAPTSAPVEMPVVQSQGESVAEAAVADGPQVAPPKAPEQSELQQEVAKLADAAGVSRDMLCAWMQIRDFAEATDSHLTTIRKVLRAKLAKSKPALQSAAA